MNIRLVATLIEAEREKAAYEICGGVWPGFKHWHVIILRRETTKAKLPPTIIENSMEDGCEKVLDWLRCRTARRKTPLVLYVPTEAMRNYIADAAEKEEG